MKKGLRLVPCGHTGIHFNDIVGNIDLIKKGLRLCVDFLSLQPVIVGSRDLMNKGLRLAYHITNSSFSNSCWKRRPDE